MPKNTFKLIAVEPTSGGLRPSGKVTEGTIQNDAFTISASYLSDGFGEDFIISGGKGTFDYLYLPVDSHFLTGLSTPYARKTASISQVGKDTQFVIREQGLPRNTFRITDIEYLVTLTGVFKIGKGLMPSTWSPKGYRPPASTAEPTTRYLTGSWKVEQSRLLITDSAGSTYYSSGSDISAWPPSVVDYLLPSQGASSSDAVGHVVSLNEPYNARAPLSGSWFLEEGKKTGIGLFPDGSIAGWILFDSSSTITY